MKALLSIKPEFAFQIFAGNKKFEYRRKIFKQPVDTIVVYVSSPISMVLGEFEIEDLLFDNLDELWNKTKCEAGISEEFFYQYFTKKELGYAIKIGKVTQFDTPLPLGKTYGLKPPQFFAYI
jgi:predicted transcriptional regulator